MAFFCQLIILLLGTVEVKHAFVSTQNPTLNPQQKPLESLLIRRQMFRKTMAIAAVGMGSFLFSAMVQAREQIQIVGSSTVYPFVTVVAERHGFIGKWKTPVVESTGTGGGMKLFCAGIGPRHPDITNASRAIKASEKKLCQQNGVTEIIEIVVGNDGIAFANSIQSKRFSLTRQQIWLAMAEKGPKPKRWNEIDSSLPKQPIEILVPPPTSGTRDAWNSLVMVQGCVPEVKQMNKKFCALLREDGKVVEAGENDTLIIQKLNANPNAFGIFGFSYYDNNRDRIQAAVIDGVLISLEKIQNETYPISRLLFFYVKKQHIGVIPGLQEYLTEFTSNAAMGDFGYLSDLGLVPMSLQKRKTVQKIAVDLAIIPLL